MSINRPWSGCAALLFWLTLAGSLSGTSPGWAADPPAPARPDLTGTVHDPEGNPLPKASVFIYTAGPKEGVGILCPSCYADCRKRTTTDSQGRFKLESLDPTLQFRILVVAKGRQPKFVAKVDPAQKPLEVTLMPANGGVTPDRQLKGRVVGPSGEPVSGAVVSIRGVSHGPTTRFGGNEDLDQVAVSDEDGLFVLNGNTSFEAAGIDIEARGYAKGIFPHLATGGKVHELKLGEGASVQGRLLRDGKPVPGAEMGICGADREASVYVGDFSVGTDKEGRFHLVNLPPNREYWLYGKMGSIGEGGAVSAQRVHVEQDGSVKDVGDLNVRPGLILAGRVRLTDGKPVPAKTRLLLSRKEAWNSVETQVGSDGRFRFSAVPPESVALSCRVRGYRLSAQNKSLNPGNPYALEGLLKADKPDLIVELEPGEASRTGASGYLDLSQEPLLGAEATPAAGGDFHVTGSVTDADSGKALERFTITEGRVEFNDRINWFETRQTRGTNGVLDVYLNKGRGAPAISVEAEGYLPASSGPIHTAETNLVFALKKGSGASGIVLLPDGQPASEMKVYLADMRNGVYIQDASMKVDSRIYQGTRTTTTDANGHFIFTPRVDDYAVMVVADSGFAQVPVEQLRRTPEVKLQPWAKVEGKLLVGTHPGTNETDQLGLAFLPYEFYPREFPPLSLFLHTTTDAEGRFSFERVPPINVEVYHSPKVREEGAGTIPMSQETKFALAPGETKVLTLGGQGRPVVGQVLVNGYDGVINWRAEVQSLELVQPPNPAVPDMLAAMREASAKIQAADSEEEKARLMAQMQKDQQEAAQRQRAFYRTEAGRDYAFQSRRYALSFTNDGRFRVEDVPGGKYRLRIDLREGGSGPMRFSAPRIAGIEKEFEIPESPGGRSDEPFDLGKIELQARKTLGTKAAAPDFEVKTIDGKTVKLSDWRGKYVLLDFWAVWCGPCVAETPHLKATYEAFKNDERFRMLGLSLDPNIKTPADYARKNGLGWTIGHLGEWSKADLPAQYGVEGIPAIFLIGPDGKVIAKDLRGENIKAAVQKALAKAGS